MTSPLARIPELAAWLAASGIDELELRGPEGQVRLARGIGPSGSGGSTAAAAGPSPRAEPAPGTVRSPGVGHFLPAHPLRAESLVVPGERIAAGQPVGLLRVGALLLTVTAPRAGTVIRVVAPEGALVGYGDPLIDVRPEE
ncbi:acetyl-CoA carboxylase biotin carboxyl carrier protein [Methylobacterium frigidaeris]|uniref:Biotin carboxyl carrier protein of acetyl-CoA carboxylase n=1 Tax=Methylobacterium frigidaeris TaxID=2038277 RepID=A0AA37HHG6_9HYPH|nr:acetyl-CoA carboxylase biotin carboxyl carrier protein subunit [Methylobacterium frigidaeris]PIK73914.1 acetyl-CoA carboxylase biotin carboxyl carrier protein subunit [Methylobacterium frigidaeris]GJD66177.1 Biotin carboxyl carrier protein of acetyl-CoA carboxylase [Methylobacterium frigidaeris]